MIKNDILSDNSVTKTLTSINTNSQVDNEIDNLIADFDLTPNAIQSSTPISAQKIAEIAILLSNEVGNLDFQGKLKTLHDLLDGLISDIPASERAPIEKALSKIFSDITARDFLAKVPAPTTGMVFDMITDEEMENRPPKQWIIDQVAGAGDLVVIYGAPGTGKTFVVFDLIVSACTGMQWANRFTVSRPLNTAYCFGEGTDGISGRYKAAKSFRKVKSLPNIRFSPVVPQLFDGEKAIKSIQRFVSEWKTCMDRGQVEALDLLFIDTLATASIGANENDNGDMGKIVAACRHAAAELGCAVILVHHANKAGTGERGATALRGAADCMIEIRRSEGAVATTGMICSKLKDGESWKPQTFEMHRVEEHKSACILWDEPSDSFKIVKPKAADKIALQAEMERCLGQKLTVKHLSMVIEQSEDYTRTMLGELEKAGVCQRELSNPDKPLSKTNPSVFFISAKQSELL